MQGVFMRGIVIFSFIFSFSILALSAEDFRFTQNEGMEYRIVSEVQESVWFDTELLGQSSILNRIGVKVVESDGDGALLDVSYGISEKSLDSGLYIYNSDEMRQFYRSHRGVYGPIPLDEYLPSVRNIPTFPEREIEPGESWSEMAEEIHDLKHFFSLDYRLHIPFRVFYTYAGKDEYEGRSVDVIHINYHFLQGLDLYSLPVSVIPEDGVDLPEYVSGDFKQVYLWDPEAGIPAAVEEEFQIVYKMLSGVRYTFKGSASGKVVEADQWKKEDVRNQIEEAVVEMEDVSVSISDDGVVLSLEDIHFKPDSAEFLPGEVEKLMQLKDILLQFPDHDLLITGHTARVGLSPDMGQGLSEDRAGAVASFLLSQEVRRDSQMVVQGMGSREPLGDNSTEEGRRKNRRVEITILDN
ncbi:OmpA family protein [Oceanispirochaeta crateris]|uniref:OmpA family protein n=2 Tax=Oceanispirochaeta crateris TaxID=2518645 RepID=A0A5C1QMJ2_9SPIO|nr:OmpA family protein [Oceanispirochaeta crateris]